MIQLRVCKYQHNDPNTCKSHTESRLISHKQNNSETKFMLNICEQDQLEITTCKTVIYSLSLAE